MAGEYALGAMLVLFFGAGGLALALPLLTRHGEEAVHVADVGFERGFLFPYSRAKQGLSLVALVGMTAGSALLAVVGAVLIGVLCAALFGTVAVLSLVRLRRREGLA